MPATYHDSYAIPTIILCPYCPHNRPIFMCYDSGETMTMIIVTLLTFNVILDCLFVDEYYYQGSHNHVRNQIINDVIFFKHGSKKMKVNKLSRTSRIGRTKTRLSAKRVKKNKNSTYDSITGVVHLYQNQGAPEYLYTNREWMEARNRNELGCQHVEL